MRLSSSIVLAAGLILAAVDGVYGGSRHWESKAPNMRSNPNPSYNSSAGAISKRAMSIKVISGDPASSRLWPNKKIRYCFDEDPPPVQLRGMWEQAKQYWAPLMEHGFSYEEVSRKKCVSDRKNVLRIHYNSDGRLSSTVAVPSIDEKWNREHPDKKIEGPFTHLSDATDVGNLDINANAAHELGHVWGLYHEHQNSLWWRTSDEHQSSTDPYWGYLPGSDEEARFETNGFDCTALKDYETARAAVEEAVAENPNDPNLSTHLATFCSSRSVASEYSFNAAEWLPIINMGRTIADDTFDPDSLMLYPSGAGGRGDAEQGADGRMPVLRYRNGDLIPVRLRPSNQDIERLVSLYGSESQTTETPHNVGSLRSKFRRARDKISRAGDTKSGLC